MAPCRRTAAPSPPSSPPSSARPAPARRRRRPARPPPPPPSPAVLAYQVLDVRDAALNARDPDTAARAYAEGAIVIDADRAAIVLRGRAEIREAHARFLEACPRARVEVLDRSFGEQGRIVTDVERVRCGWDDPVQGWVRYEIAGGTILRVLKHRSPPFGG
jgi:nuclear transport factor 2 (NTF2) superfamily protein